MKFLLQHRQFAVDVTIDLAVNAIRGPLSTELKVFGSEEFLQELLSGLRSKALTRRVPSRIPFIHHATVVARGEHLSAAFLLHSSGVGHCGAVTLDLSRFLLDVLQGELAQLPCSGDGLRVGGVALHRLVRLLHATAALLRTVGND